MGWTSQRGEVGDLGTAEKLWFSFRPPPAPCLNNRQSVALFHSVKWHRHATLATHTHAAPTDDCDGCCVQSHARGAAAARSGLQTTAAKRAAVACLRVGNEQHFVHAVTTRNRSVAVRRVADNERQVERSGRQEAEAGPGAGGGGRAGGCACIDGDGRACTFTPAAGVRELES